MWVALKRAVGGKCQQVKLNSLLLLWCLLRFDCFSLFW